MAENRVTQSGVDVVYGGSGNNAIVSQSGVEVVLQYEPNAVISQSGIEVLIRGTDLTTTTSTPGMLLLGAF